MSEQRYIKAALRSAVRELGIRKDAVEAALTLADTSGVLIDEDGNVNGINSVSQALLSKYPYLFEKTKPRSIGGSFGHFREKPSSDYLLAKAAEVARNSGRIEDRIAYAALKTKTR